MDQHSLNRIWEQVLATGEPIDGVVGRRNRSQDFLMRLADGRLWSRSHEIDVWSEAAPIRARPSSMKPVPLRFDDRTAHVAA